LKGVTTSRSAAKFAASILIVALAALALGRSGNFIGWLDALRDGHIAFRSAGGFYDVRDYGAIADGRTLDTAAIQAAIDRAARFGGGVVVLSSGTYVSGTIHLRSNITLRVLAGASLQASTNDRDFDSYERPNPGSITANRITWAARATWRRPQVHIASLLRTIDDPDTTYTHYSLIVADGVANITIDGGGTIDGNRLMRGGPKLITLRRCRHARVLDVTLRNAPCYNISLVGSDDVVIDGITIINGYADGIDPDDSRNIRIANCYIDTWDDAICAKASLALGHPMATRNLVVTNCILKTSNNGFKLGTESEGDFRDIAVSNCVVLRRDRGRAPITGVELDSVDGGAIDGVAISNMVMRGVRTPIFLRLGDRGRGMATPHPGSINNIVIDDIIAHDAVHPISLSGLPGFPIQDVTLDNIDVDERGGQKLDPGAIPELPAAYPQGEMFGEQPGYALYARHLKGLSLSNWRARQNAPDCRPAAAFDDVEDLELTSFHADVPEKSRRPLSMHDVRDAMIHDISVAYPRHLEHDISSPHPAITLHGGGPLGAPHKLETPRVNAHLATVRTRVS
jgi:polygalacturonase